MAQEHSAQTLELTALVRWAYLRLVGRGIPVGRAEAISVPSRPRTSCGHAAGSLLDSRLPVAPIYQPLTPAYKKQNEYLTSWPLRRFPGRLPGTAIVSEALGLEASRT
jgi:hypothetical protein